MSLPATQLPEAQAQHLARLKALVMDRKPHARYLATLLAAPVDGLDQVDVPRDVSRAVAEALRDDVFWCRRVHPGLRPKELVAQFPDAYHRLRNKNAHRAAARRADRANGPASLRALLRLGQ